VAENSTRSLTATGILCRSSSRHCSKDAHNHVLQTNDGPAAA
jgi:hypothetical protein